MLLILYVKYHTSKSQKEWKTAGKKCVSLEKILTAIAKTQYAIY